MKGINTLILSRASILEIFQGYIDSHILGNKLEVTDFCFSGDAVAVTLNNREPLKK